MFSCLQPQCIIIQSRSEKSEVGGPTCRVSIERIDILQQQISGMFKKTSYKSPESEISPVGFTKRSLRDAPIAATQLQLSARDMSYRSGNVSVTPNLEPRTLFLKVDMSRLRVSVALPLRVLIDVLTKKRRNPRCVVIRLI